MAEIINIPARYGYTHKLIPINDTTYQLETDKNSTGLYRLIGFENEETIGNFVYAIDPEGGPFIAVGSKLANRIVKSIRRDGIIEFE